MMITRIATLAGGTATGIQVSPTWEAAIASAIASILILLATAVIAMAKAWLRKRFELEGNDDLEDEPEDQKEK